MNIMYKECTYSFTKYNNENTQLISAIFKHTNCLLNPSIIIINIIIIYLLHDDI